LFWIMSGHSILIVSCILLLSFGSVFTTPINVEILGFGYKNPAVGHTSLALIGPTYRLAVEELQKKYSDNFNFSINFLYEEGAINCVSMNQNGDDILSRWYYGKNRTSMVSAVFVAGKINQSINQ
jgi:hypothetical protein